MGGDGEDAGGGVIATAAERARAADGERRQRRARGRRALNSEGRVEREAQPVAQREQRPGGVAGETNAFIESLKQVVDQCSSLGVAVGLEPIVGQLISSTDETLKILNPSS